MSEDFERARLLDKTGRQILYLLQEDARMPLAEIGRRVGLAAPSVAERVRRMEQGGIITGYHAVVDLEKIGLPVTLYIEFMSRDGHYEPVEHFLAEHPAVSEFYCIAGEVDILIRASFASMEDLDPFLQHLSRYGKAITLVVLKVSRTRRSLGGTG